MYHCLAGITDVIKFHIYFELLNPNIQPEEVDFFNKMQQSFMSKVFRLSYHLSNAYTKISTEN